ncbi:MAG: YlbF family regulator [Phycisphaeraceae bacterium]|nr:YlbF family regulator [Phycisphaeraceae bacterium]
MATKEAIIDAATNLGKLIADNSVGKKLESAIGKLEKDTAAQQELTQYQQFIQALGEKEAAGQPIEVEEKQKLQALQNLVVQNLTLQQFQVAQMDYLDLMREVDQIISAQATGQQAAANPAQPSEPASPLITPNMM